MNIPGTPLELITTDKGTVYFCPICNDEVNPLGVLAEGKVVPVCQDCFLNTLIEQQADITGEAGLNALPDGIRDETTASAD
jgi:hypothetical protein